MARPPCDEGIGYALHILRARFEASARFKAFRAEAAGPLFLRMPDRTPWT
jgi:hypothetical protein